MAVWHIELKRRKPNALTAYEDVRVEVRIARRVRLESLMRGLQSIGEGVLRLYSCFLNKPNGVTLVNKGARSMERLTRVSACLQC